jgi:dTDP-4-amino-4,6-dideoxygalactose transaminase
MENKEVDPAFLFALGGTNMRPTDIHAMFGLQDFKRIDRSKKHRKEIYELFVRLMDHDKYYVPQDDLHVAFCFPILRRDEKIAEVKLALTKMGCESRPIIGSNLLYQPPFKKYGDPQSLPNAEWVHRHGCYCGVHLDVTKEMVEELTQTLNNIE